MSQAVIDPTKLSYYPDGRGIKGGYKLSIIGESVNQIAKGMVKAFAKQGVDKQSALDDFHAAIASPEGAWNWQKKPGVNSEKVDNVINLAIDLIKQEYAGRRINTPTRVEYWRDDTVVSVLRYPAGTKDPSGKSIGGRFVGRPIVLAETREWEWTE